MPCDAVYTTQVNVAEFKAESLELLKAALEALDYVVTIRGDQLTANHREHGTISYRLGDSSLRQETTRGQYPTAVNDIKVAYSTQVVKKVASRFGWNVKQSATQKQGVAVAFTASKRRF